MTLEEKAEAMRAAFAEAGYPFAEVTIGDQGIEVGFDDRIPLVAIWRSFRITGWVACWECWSFNVENRYMTPDPRARVCDHEIRAGA